MIPFDAPAFTISGVNRGRVVSIHDGDTLTCVMYYCEGYFKFSVRMDGIDTPEMTSKDPELKNRALAARDRLFHLVCNGFEHINTTNWKKKDFDEFFRNTFVAVNLDCKGLDKYGRLLATIGNPSFSSILVQEGLAYPYSGKTKLTEQEQLDLKLPQ